jgi:hypothetical protein
VGYRYKVIPFIGQSKGSVSPAGVARQLESVISEHAVDGWEFYQLSDVNIEVQPGCLAGLFGANTQYMRFDQVIFRTGQRASTLAQPATPAPIPQMPAWDPVPTASHQPIERGVPSTKDSDRTSKPTEHFQQSESRPETPTNINPSLLEVWQQKTDQELRNAASSIDQYTETGRQVILAELARRGIALDDREQLTFCYHCGADVTSESSVCTGCGKKL